MTWLWVMWMRLYCRCGRTCLTRARHSSKTQDGLEVEDKKMTATSFRQQTKLVRLVWYLRKRKLNGKKLLFYVPA